MWRPTREGDIYVYTRTGNPTITIGTARAVSHGGGRLFQFDRTGKYVREIGQGIYGFLQPQQVRVDPQDNVWVVDQMSTQVIKFDSNGRVQMVLSRKPEAMTVPAPRLTPLPTGIPVDSAGAAGRRRRRQAAAGAAEAAPLPGAGVEGESFSRPTDVAWDAQGNIYVADGYGNARVAKYDRNGKWLKNWGSRGTGQGQFNIVHGIAIDAQGNVYVGDEGNKRVQVFDTEGTFKTQFTNVGAPTALCLTRGRAAGAVCRAHRRSRRHGRRGDLQGRSEGQRARQVRQRRQAAEGVRPREFDRLPQRERAAGRRARATGGSRRSRCARRSRNQGVRRRLKGMRRTLFLCALACLLSVHASAQAAPADRRQSPQRRHVPPPSPRRRNRRSSPFK